MAGEIRRFGRFLCAAVLLVCFCPPVFSQPLPRVGIGVVYDGPAPLFHQNRQMLIDEIIELTAGEFDVRFDEDAVVDGQWDKERIARSVAALMADPEVDILLCLGVMASAEIASYASLSKPVIASSVYAGQIGDPHVGRPRLPANLNVIVSSGEFDKTLDAFLRFKAFTHLALIVDRHVLDAVPGLAAYYEKAGADRQVRLDVLPAGDRADDVLDRLPDTVDGVLVAPLLSFPLAELDRLIDGLNRRKLPGFSLLGRSDVTRGLLAGLTYGAESLRLIRRIALNVQRILLGESPDVFDSSFSDQGNVVINMETARLIGFYPEWDILARAELIHEKDNRNLPRLDLATVMETVLTQNPDMAAGRNRVAAGEQEVNKARSYLIPKVTLESTGIVIDENRAELSFGTESEKKWDAGITAGQMLFSEKAWSGWRSVKHLQEARLQEFETLKLDLCLEAARAYMNVLRARTFERILTNNLKLTEANLNRARTRQTVGTAGASEVYRWESEIAKKKKERFAAQASVAQAAGAFNRILGYPLSHETALDEVSVSDPVLLISDERFLPRVNTPEKLRRFNDFMVQEGLDRAPELKRLDAALKAGKQQVLSARRAHYLPEVALKGQISDVFDRDGFSQVADARDKTAWSVAVNASFPLFTGGAKTADYLKTREELGALRMERQSAAARIEEKIRFMLEEAKASYRGIALARDAARAAAKNLELVTDAYARGMVSIIDLLDAQNASMMADLGADNAVYDFVIDMLGVQRAIGHIDFSGNDSVADDFFRRLDRFEGQAGS
ncbi:TolC family protein [Desulfatiferula olefinivorans]